MALNHNVYLSSVIETISLENCYRFRFQKIYIWTAVCDTVYILYAGISLHGYVLIIDTVAKLNVKRPKVPCNVEAWLQYIGVVRHVRRFQFNSTFNPL